MDDVKKMSGEELVSRFENTLEHSYINELLHRLNDYERLKKIVEDAPHGDLLRVKEAAVNLESVTDIANVTMQEWHIKLREAIAACEKEGK